MSKVTGPQHDPLNKHGITSIVLILDLPNVCKEKYVIYIHISGHLTVNFIIFKGGEGGKDHSWGKQKEKRISA